MLWKFKLETFILFLLYNHHPTPLGYCVSENNTHTIAFNFISTHLHPIPHCLQNAIKKSLSIIIVISMGMIFLPCFVLSSTLFYIFFFSSLFFLGIYFICLHSISVVSFILFHLILVSLSPFSSS